MKINIAIDGPSASGKSTIAKRLAKMLNYVHIDTGSMYRATAYKALARGISLEDEVGLVNLLDQTSFDFTSEGQLIMDGKIVGSEIRNPQCDKGASLVSKLEKVRAKLVLVQQQITEKKGFILDGRDIGTVVFPNAQLKFFLDADLAVRADRRLTDLRRAGATVEASHIRDEVARRDARDRAREVAPLRAAPDAIRIDSSSLDAEAVVAAMLAEVAKILNQDKS